MKLNAFGISCGIGSMLIGAKSAGFKIVGNVEDRKDFLTGTFQNNFPKSIFINNFESTIKSWKKESPENIDLVMAHPPCGTFSELKNIKGPEKDKVDNVKMILNTIKLANPKFFVIDNLPKLLGTFTAKWWAKTFPEYDIFFELISNYHYGNVQKHRIRLFIIGAHKSQSFVFHPGEKENNLVLKDVIEDLLPVSTYNKIPNHRRHVLDEKCSKAYNLHKFGVRYSWRDLQKYIKEKPEGFNVEYFDKDGNVKKRFGFRKAYWNGPSGVLVGKNATIHPIRNLPFTIRERARIQGAPDDFIFVGERLNENNTWNHDLNLALTRQTGRFIPVEFCTYISKQIKAHLIGKKFKCSGVRLGKENEIINEAKLKYCKITEYSNKEACDLCWLSDRCPNLKF